MLFIAHIFAKIKIIPWQCNYGTSTCIAPCVTSSVFSVWPELLLRLILFWKVPHCEFQDDTD